TLRYARAYSTDNQSFADKMQITVQTLVDNYEAFASAKVPMQIIYQVNDAESTSTKNSRLYEIFFTENE
ncbi:MAG: hypothetical protein IJB97_10075, partial [Clostridia bacterium]|nr:hypothetical protein [Clostridia bacterium]